MENTSSCRWADRKETTDISSHRQAWRAKLRQWRNQRQQRRLGYLNTRLARKLDLTESQARQLEKFLLQIEHFRHVFHEERENSITNVLRVLDDESADLTPVGQGLDSSVERLHLQLDKILEDFSVWVATLNVGQRQYLKQQIAHKFKRPFSHRVYNDSLE